MVSSEFVGCDDKCEALAESAQQMGRILTCTALWASGKANTDTVLIRYYLYYSIQWAQWALATRRFYPPYYVLILID